MEIKLFEIRDDGTFIPAMAVLITFKESDSEAYLLKRAGYATSVPCVLLSKIKGGPMTYDPSAWGGRTMATAHKYIIERWNDLESNAVIDVEFILGETTYPKTSDRT